MVEASGQTASHSHHHVRTVASAEDYPLERLLDPANDRQMTDVPRPPRYPMNIENLYHTVDGMCKPEAALAHPRRPSHASYVYQLLFVLWQRTVHDFLSLKYCAKK